MKFRCVHFRTGVALTAFIAIVALQIAQVPGLAHIGALSIALLLGIAGRAALHVPESQHVGISFSARQLLRVAIVMLGVRLNFDLVIHAGPRILLLAASVITMGLLLITWLGRRFGLPGMLPLLLAVDSSICGASAVAAAAPVIRAKDHDIALAVPLCSLIGTLGMLGLAAARHIFGLAPATYGVLAGATLHEIAQVLAATAAAPGALELGTITKLTRVCLLVPAVLILGAACARARREAEPEIQNAWQSDLLGSMWFVIGFLLVGAANSLLFHMLPAQAAAITAADARVLEIATFLMAMAMAGLGLQVDFARIRENGLRAAVVAMAGWLALVALAAVEITGMRL